MAASGLLLSACATMFGSDQTITITPSQEAGNGARVVVESSSGTQRVQLPATVSVRSGPDRVVVRIEDERYDHREVRSGRSVRGVYWVNILNIPVGFFVDYLTGTMWKYDELIVVPTDPKG